METHLQNSGILKNKDEQPLVSYSPNDKHQKDDLIEFRKKVYENTLLNSKLTSTKNKSNIVQKPKGLNLTDSSISTNHLIPKDSLELKLEATAAAAATASHNSLSEEPAEDLEKLQWNQKNLEENEITKLKYQDIHIDEPKTPYQGAVDPSGEYYTVDDDEFDINNGGAHGTTLESFSLGDPVLSNVEIENSHFQLNEEQEEEEEEEEEHAELTPEEKHRKFEEMRKKHYNIKNVLKTPPPVSDDEEEEEEEDI